MKKFIIGICAVISCVAMCSCGHQDQDNPLSGKDTDERIIMSLEKTYPEHIFQVVKKYGLQDDEYYGVYKDEKGLKFKADNILYNNRYHFGCYDEYLSEILKKQNIIEKASDAAKKYGYKFDYDQENEALTIEITMSDSLTPEAVAIMLKEVLDSVKIPVVQRGDEVFSTGVVNYFSSPKMIDIGYDFITDDGRSLAFDGVEFMEQDASVEELSVNIQKRLDEARRNL